MRKNVAIVIVLLVLGGGIFWNAHAAIPLAERNALIDLYNSTDGANWDDNTKWLGASGTEDTWYGVNIEADHVKSIYLLENSLTGTIPSSIGNLTNLEELSLWENQLTGSIPAQLGNLTNLEELSLWENQLTGSIPTQLGNLSNLQILFLGYNQLTGTIPAQLGNLTNLEYLHLLDNQLTGSIPTELGNLSNLLELYLSDNDLTGAIPAELGNLSNLQNLDLSHNQLNGSIPAELGNLINLQILFLVYNHLTGAIPAELGNLTSLEEFYLHNNHLTGAIPAELGNLMNLKLLLLDSNQLTGPIPTELTNLTNLEDDQSEFRWNALYTSDTALRTFLNNKQSGGDWESSQTVTPTNLAAGIPSGTSVPLTWTAITYTDGDTGSGYEVYYTTTSGGPYTLFETTEDKTVETTTVTGLMPYTIYFFRLRTVTNHYWNIVYSKYTDEVSATTTTGTNIPPTADAGCDQNVKQGDTVTLDGSYSTDPDDGIATYQWIQLSGTSVTLSDPTAVQCTFTAPTVGFAGEPLHSN